MRPEVRMARYLEGLSRYRAGGFSCVEAAEFLGVHAILRRVVTSPKVIAATLWRGRPKEPAL